MALKRKADDAGDEDDKEQGEPTAKRSKGPRKGGRRVLVSKVLVGTVEGHLQRDCPHINDEGNEKAWPTSGAWRSWRPGQFPGPTVQQWNSWFPKPSTGKGEGKSGKGGTDEGFGSEIGVSVRGQRSCPARSRTSRLFCKRHQKLGHDPSQDRTAHDDDVSFPELGSDTCTK